MWSDGFAIARSSRSTITERQSAAEQYVVEALEEETELSVEQVTLAELGGTRARLTVELTWRGQPLQVTAEVP